MNDQSPAAGRRRNFYQGDSSLQYWLRRHASEVVQRHTPRLTAFGDWVANNVDQAAAYTDRFAPPILTSKPVLSDPQADGMLMTEVLHNPAYAEIHRDAYRHGMIGLAYSAAPAALSEPTAFLPGFVMGYLLAQADISIHCPVTLTGAVAYVLDRFAPQEIKSHYLPDLIRMDGAAATGGTWATERQGGSDVGANATVAEPRNDGSFALRGLKWFCSNAASDLALATARPAGAPGGSDGLGLYLVPRRLDDGSLNRYRVRRLKDKLGTRGLATGEIELQGAIGFEVAPPKRGLRIMMEALGYSRIHNAMAAVGVQRRAFVEALGHARQRQAFGAPLVAYPAIEMQLLDLQADWMASLVLALATAQSFDLAQQDAGQQVWLRLLTALAKYRTAEDAVRSASRAVEILGGNGYTEEYPTARLLRDALVLPVWEGPANIQALEVLRLILGKSNAGGLFERQVSAMLISIGGEMAASVPPLQQALRSYHQTLEHLRSVPASGPCHIGAMTELMADLICATLLLREAAAEGNARLSLIAARYIRSRFGRRPHAGPDVTCEPVSTAERAMLENEPAFD
ncbi:acyl-CoA dehydrogenase family protein [Dongia soli]|uniref:Acyl-CoA dehydrogenase family protein n=1 Tax=Dongia soli TaxID=600628 RepID=A0ABU5E6P1_9PROT|nr:acyl-CoA dehydrogenase family protein [Dongia soli]MDY0881557.1 acyl-CoA dehydrogenase family protein [Dongia soli]